MKTKFNPWPFGIMGVYITLICGLAATVAIAVTHRDSLVSDRYYEEEIKYQGQIDGATRAREAGARLQFDPATSQLKLQVPPAHLGQGFTGTVEFYRPADARQDRQAPLALESNGTQIFDLSKMIPGLWRVRVNWNADGRDYFLEERVAVSPR